MFPASSRSPPCQVPAAAGDFSCHSCIFLVYSRCSVPREPALTDVALPWHTCQSGGGSAMTFEELLDQAIALLQRRGRLTYRALKRQFNLDDDYLEDLKAELIQGQRLAVDEDGAVLVWTGRTDVSPRTTPPAPKPGAQPGASDAPRTPILSAPVAPRPTD